MKSTPAWHVTAWQPVFTTMAAIDAAMGKMRHLGTSFTDGTDARSSRCGQTVWGTVLHGKQVGIAWDWGEVCSGVVALSDPMLVVSNLCLVDADGVCLDDDHRVLNLNALIHQLPWQTAVRAPRCRARRALAA